MAPASLCKCWVLEVLCGGGDQRALQPLGHSLYHVLKSISKHPLDCKGMRTGRIAPDTTIVAAPWWTPQWPSPPASQEQLLIQTCIHPLCLPQPSGRCSKL